MNEREKKEKKLDELVNKVVFGGLKDRIESIIRERLQVDAEYEVHRCIGYCGCFVRLEESGTATEKVFSSHPLLAQVFDEAKILVEIWPEDEDNEIIAEVHLGYKRIGCPGTDGCDLLNITFKGDEETIEIC